MKKMLKIVAAAALVVVIVALVGFAVLKVLASQPAAPDNYQQTVQAGGPIEQTYLANEKRAQGRACHAAQALTCTYSLLWPTPAQPAPCTASQRF